MPENAKSKPAAPAPDAGHVPITEEFDRAKWMLPPVVPIVIAVAAVAIVVAIVVFSNRAEPVAAASIVKVASADQSGNTMVGIQVKLDNKIPKQLWIKDISAELETADGKKYSDSAAPSVDVGRYLQAFPALQEVKSDPLREELKIPAGTSFTGFSIFSYPVDKAAFDGRKSLTVKIGFYDQPTLIAKQ
ncbi:MAG TPA: hypothetical protein VKW06_05160 [Candidatus Angelobacter sp.]|nr:hypothetical protein [Candidatus Angelobacter sp.]